MLLLVFFAFLAGFVTILSPCILPVLPIVLSGSLSGGKSRPLGVVTGFVGSFTFFTLFLSSIVRATGIPSDLLRNSAVILIFVFGIFLVIPQAQTLFEKLFTKLSSLQKADTSNQTGFWGGVLIGASLGLVWAPCVGPILASVITLSITSQVGLAATLITLSYAIGTAIPMLLITYYGRRLFAKVPWLLEHTVQIQQFFGVLLIFTAIGLYYNVETRFQAYILDKFPQYGAGLTQLEDIDIVQEQLNELQGNTQTIPTEPQNPDQLLLEPGIEAPGFQSEQSWINSEPLTLEALRGKVVLIDFWTYTCINCIRTFPYLRDWYAKYNDLGFEIIGVHSPEFEFEKERSNVVQASENHDLVYPIVQDNEFRIWRAYNNRFWPAHYLIDKNGDIRYTHFGEGKYLETENAIRMLLDEEPLEETDEQQTRRRQTPEIYLGYQRAENYVRDNNIQLDTAKEYSQVSQLPDDAVDLSGNWVVGPESITATEAGAQLRLNFIAARVHLVLTPDETTSEPQTVRVTLNGKPLPEKYLTTDMDETGTITLSESDKYDIIELGEDYGRHTIELTFSKGVSAFAFTFGS